MLDYDSLQRIVDDVCDTMLGLGLQRVGQPVAKSANYQATIRILGEKESHLVELSVSAWMARHIASSMFAIEDADLSNEELSDALGEVVNMIGGNIKGVLGGDGDLSLPDVGLSREHDEQSVKPGLLVTMDRQGESLSVRLQRLCSTPVDA